MAEVADALAVWLPGEEELSERVLKVLNLREGLRARPGTRGLGEVRAEATKCLNEAILLGLEKRLGFVVGVTPGAPGLVPSEVIATSVRVLDALELLLRLGGFLPDQIGVCHDCGFVWRRPVRANLAERCDDCSKRGHPPGVEVHADGSYYVRPIQQVRRMGLAAWGMQPCAVCGLHTEVKVPRTYCGGACRQRASRRRATGLPIRDARDPAWIDPSRLAQLNGATCSGCHEGFFTADGEGLCPRCRDIAAGHQEYLPAEAPTVDGVTGLTEGWKGIREPQG